MRVKRLEIQGFKSFKDKTVVHFDHKITGIVGPNGCGKSNIVDAFFWVMGEQSYKHMRGNSSEDLIFNGSSKYSALGMAEATLVMETEVADPGQEPAGATVQDIPPSTRKKEISVTRRLYRSGEGEYFINGTLVRLKDIHELFMDTGVGAKGYSVIEQGQIGKIVNAKPEERRLLIEEAAGIAKYKARKKESLRKMEATQLNLSRLTDIILEIEKSLASLERQAQKARQYKKYKDELFDKEMAWGRRKIKVFKQKLDSLKSHKETLEQELAGMRAELQIAENSTEIDRIRLLTETKDSEVFQTRVQDLTQDLSQERSALELSRRRQGDLASQLASLEGEQEELELALSSDLERLTETDSQAQEADQVFQSAAIEARQLGDVLNQLRKTTEATRHQLDSSQRDLMSKISQISDLTSKTSGLLSKAETARSQAERVAVQIEAQLERIEEVNQELTQSKLEAETVLTQCSQLQSEKKDQSSHLHSQEQDLRLLERTRNESLRNLTQLKSRLQSLEELDQSYEGLGDGPKAALDIAKTTGRMNALSALTDQIEVEKGFESVLENWLEQKIETLITDDAQLAQTLIEKVRNDKQGRVGIQYIHPGLIPLVSPASDYKTVETLLEQNGFKVLGALSQFVKAKEPFRIHLDALFEQVCVVESAKPLSEFLEKTDSFQILQGWSLVSRDGIALGSQGMIRGGTLDASGLVGILKRKHAIKELEKEVKEADSQHQLNEDSAASAKQAIEMNRARLQTLQSELQTLEIQSAALQRDVHQTERALSEARARHKALEQDFSEINAQIERTMGEREAVDERLQDLILQRIELESSISIADQNLSEKEEGVLQQDAELQAIRLKEASSKERAFSLKRELEGIRSVKQDRERRLSEIQRILDRALREREEYSGGESELAEKVEELTLELATARQSLSGLKDQIEISNAKVNKTLERIKELHKSGEKRTSESNHLSLEIEKLSGELSYLVLNLEEKYGPGCLERPLENVSLQENGGSGLLELEQNEIGFPIAIMEREMTLEEEIILGEEVERLRERIRRLGEVNVMAIEEYDQLKKRYDHLISEKQDLEKSLQNLQDAIEHINKTSEDRFKRAFEAIASRFERLFPIIFGGGQAKLSLIYPEGSNDILEAGVDILAQPPGKKVANITLLSGGEKALTAVSLIFAIFMVKPSPFCVLDEVDAPLDDANIGKFNALLREMSVKSQFILITHNKKTMELNDTLYGVTMEEPGVSKMVSIEMR